MSTEYVPGRTAMSSSPAALAEVVCADPDLLALEFDALMAANYPEVADRPDPRPPRRTGRLLARRLPPRRPSLSARRQSAPIADEQADEEHAWARQRGPPAATPAGRPSTQEVMPGRRTGRDRSPLTAHARLHMHQPNSSGRPRTPATTSPAATRPSPEIP